MSQAAQSEPTVSMMHYDLSIRGAQNLRVISYIQLISSLLHFGLFNFTFCM